MAKHHRGWGSVAPIEVVARGELLKRLVETVMELEEPYRKTTLLRFFEDLAPRDIAARMARIARVLVPDEARADDQ